MIFAAGYAVVNSRMSVNWLVVLIFVTVEYFYAVSNGGKSYGRTSFKWLVILIFTKSNAFLTGRN